MTDTERLEWIGRQDSFGFGFGVIGDASRNDEKHYVFTDKGTGFGATFREAVDAAIAVEQKVPAPILEL